MAQSDRMIVGAIITGGKIFKAGDEVAFAKRMKGRDLTALVEKGQLSGDWTAPAAKADTPKGDAPKGDAPVTSTATNPGT